MKDLNANCRLRRSGQGLVVLIILVALIGGGVWWLFSHKKKMDTDARAFGRTMIERLAVNHDVAFFASSLSPQARLQYPPSNQQYLVSKLRELGVPAQPIAIEESITWESHFFQPKGIFMATLNYPGRAAKIQIATSHPVGKWQLDNIELAMDAPR
jgi:hypothetical protein